MSVDTTIKTQGNQLTFSTITLGDGLSKALAMPRVDIIDMVRDSKLKGRGGAGFPTGIKWNFAAAEKRTPKYIMCNADEGEPGTFKDRLILSEYPELVMEGMTIGARAIGASLGLIYLRAEYGYLRPHLEDVVKERKAAGLLGQDIGGDQGLQLQHHGGHGRRRLRLRRRDGAHRVARGLPRRAAQPSPVPGGLGLPQPAVGHQQRRDPGLGALHPRARGSTGSRASAPTTRPGTSCSACPATARSPACTSSPSASRSPSCSRKWAAATPRPCRSAARRAGACRRRTSSAGWPSRTSPPAARSSSSAPAATCWTWPTT